MACPQQSGNTISFLISDRKKATVIVCFTGSKQSQVTVEWGNGTSTVWQSCDPEIISGISYSETVLNTMKTLWNAEVSVTYQNLPCGTTPSPSGWQPAPSPALLVENCNPNLNPIIVGAWKFTLPNQDTVQITIVVEDEAWTGEG